MNLELEVKYLNAIKGAIKIEIKYTNTFDDYKSAYKVTLKSNKSFYRGYCIFFIAFSLLTIYVGLKLTIAVISDPYLIRYNYLNFIIIFIALLLFWRREKLVLNNRHYQEKVKSKIREITCILEKDKILYKYDNITRKILPEEIKHVIEENDTIFIIDVNRAMLLMIPNHAFKDITQKNEFIKIINEFSLRS